MLEKSYLHQNGVELNFLFIGMASGPAISFWINLRIREDSKGVLRYKIRIQDFSIYILIPIAYLFNTILTQKLLTLRESYHIYSSSFSGNINFP